MTGEATKEVSAAEISAALDNSSDSSGTQEPLNNDNSNAEQTQEPGSNTDVSDEGNQDSNQEEATDKPKFDNLDAALKGYANLEKKLGEQSNELGELRKQAELVKQLQEEQLAIAKSYGFESVEDFKNAHMQQEYDHKLAGYEADLYAQCINECDFPDEMQKLLMSYRQNPTEETLELIEADFPLKTVKKVAAYKAIAEERLNGQLQAQQQEAQREQLKVTAKAYLDENVPKYAKEFENEAFVALYSEAFRAYGCDLDTDRFVELMRAYANSITKQANINNGIDKENTDVTDEIAALVNRANAPQPPITDSDIDKMSDKELAANIRKYI